MRTHTHERDSKQRPQEQQAPLRCCCCRLDTMLRAAVLLARVLPRYSSNSTQSRSLRSFLTTTTQPPPRRRQRVAVGVSGGVDSSVTALLLSRDPRYDVVGIHMRNWNHNDEDDLQVRQCSERDENDARALCEHLKIPFHLVYIRMHQSTVDRAGC